MSDNTVASSSSFDSSNSFYSTDSSSSQNSLSTPLAATFSVADETFFNEKYQESVREKISQVLAEIDRDADFHSLVSLPEVSVDSSLTNSFCFRVKADFPQIPAESVFALFADISGRGQWDAMCDSIRVLKQIDPLTFIYHLKLKATWPSTARDSLAISAFRKLADGRFVTVAWSIVDDELCPPDQSGNFIRMHTRIASNILTPKDSGGCSLIQLIDGDPKGSIPSYLIKKVSTKSFPATMERIKQIIHERNYPENFYENVIAGARQEEAEEEELAEYAELKEIRARLQSIEAKIDKQAQTANLFQWAPLLISSISLLLLLNINRKNK